MMHAIFASILFATIALILWYSYKRFLLKLHGLPKKVAQVIAVSMFVLLLLFVVQSVTNFMPLRHAYWLFGLSIGIVFMLFVVALVYDLSNVLAKKVPFNASRRKAVKILFDITMLIVAVSYLFRGIYNGLQMPKIKRVDVKLKTSALKGLKVVQLSDVHIGNTLNKEFVVDIVAQINRLNADLVVITGDLVDAPFNTIKEALIELKHLKSTLGVYFVLGNHEYFHDLQKTIEFLPTLNITVLLNEHKKLTYNHQAFNIVGLTDIMGKRMGVLPMDVSKAYASLDESLPTVVLAHQPKSVEYMHAHRYDIMLSGHTHGGQIFPFGLLVMLQQPYLAGLYRVDNEKQIYVSRGTGYWGPAVRVLAPSEITFLTFS